MKRALVWFKVSDLRLHDHPAFAVAHCVGNVKHMFLQHTRNRPLKDTAGVLPINQVAHCFCFDSDWFVGDNVPSLSGNKHVTFRKFGKHRTRFLLQALGDLRANLRERGSDIIVTTGKPHEMITELAVKLGTEVVLSHGEFTDEEKNTDSKVAAALKEHNIGFYQMLGGNNTLFDLNQLPFDAFNEFPETYTQFRKEIEKNCTMHAPLSVPSKLKPLPESIGLISTGEIPRLISQLDASFDDDEKELLPEKANLFEGGESAALKRLKHYVWDSESIKVYKETRNGLVGMDYSSKLSPWLAFGCISPRLIMNHVKQFESQRVSNESTYWLWFELLWRDYFRFFALRYGNDIFQLGGAQHNPNKKSWNNNPIEIERIFNSWRSGQTGYPFIDSNMRELLATGFMSNRGRQVVGSFLVNDLQIDWRLGAQHFEEFLIDYDPCSNYGNWTYVAGVGSDPREDRYFNVVKQASTYDPEVEHIKMWCPELKSLKREILLDPVKNLTSFVRSMSKISESVYPQFVAPLKFSKTGAGKSKPSQGTSTSKDKFGTTTGNSREYVRRKKY